jgi:hypothetical protein
MEWCLTLPSPFHIVRKTTHIIMQTSTLPTAQCVCEIFIHSPVLFVCRLGWLGSCSNKPLWSSLSCCMVESLVQQPTLWSLSQCTHAPTLSPPIERESCKDLQTCYAINHFIQGSSSVLQKLNKNSIWSSQLRERELQPNLPCTRFDSSPPPT